MSNEHYDSGKGTRAKIQDGSIFPTIFCLLCARKYAPKILDVCLFYVDFFLHLFRLGHGLKPGKSSN